jgi:hypothetical protein
MEAPILIDVWTVDPSQRAELAGRISEGLREVILGRPGLLSAEVYESTNGDAIMVLIRMDTVEHRQALTDSPEAHRLVRELRELAHSHMRLFRLVEDFSDHGRPG